MPEAPEVPTERLHEIVHEQGEEDRLVRLVAMTTALLAAIAAVASLFAGSTVNEALVLKNESTRLQAEASDQWAYYQAKGIKASVQDAVAAAWLAAGKAVPNGASSIKGNEQAEQRALADKARELEKQRDEKSEEADRLLERHHRLAAGVALFQVAIALGAIAALTRQRSLWILSLVLGVAGAAFAVAAYF